MNKKIRALAVAKLKQDAREAAEQAAGQGGPLDGVDPDGWEPSPTTRFWICPTCCRTIWTEQVPMGEGGFYSDLYSTCDFCG